TTFNSWAEAADHLTFTSSIADLTNGSVRVLTAEIRDASNNLLTADNTTSVSFSKTAGTGNVSGLGSSTAVNGVASRSVTGSAVGSITITASAAGVPNNGTTIFNVVAPASPHGDANGDGVVN